MAVTAPDDWSKRRPSYNTSSIYHTPTWKRLRRLILRLQPMCSVCGVKPSTQVDHITALHDGGEPFDQANLQGICSTCHSIKSISERRQRAAGGA